MTRASLSAASFCSRAFLTRSSAFSTASSLALSQSILCCSNSWTFDSNSILYTRPHRHIVVVVVVMDVINVSFKFFPRFLFLKTVVKCKIWICKNPTKNTCRGCLSNDFYWFWFVTQPILQNILLTCGHWRYVLKIDNLHMTQCAKIIVGFTWQMSATFLSNVFF